MPGTQSLRLPVRGFAGVFGSLFKDISSEKANQLTHGLAFVLSVIGTAHFVSLLSDGAEFYQWIGFGAFTLTMTVLFLASTLSHSFDEGRLRHWFRTMDQLCIFIFIAGGFTPFALNYLSEQWWWLLAASWAAALAGCMAKLYIAKLETLNVLAYLVVGWIPAIAWRPLIQQIPASSQWLILASAMFYTVGTLFLINDHRGRFWHAAWHMFVIGGTVCVYFALLGCYTITLAA